MRWISAFPVVTFPLLVWACSEPRCPNTYVQVGNTCRRCPADAEPRNNVCVDVDGGIVELEETPNTSGVVVPDSGDDTGMDASAPESSDEPAAMEVRDASEDALAHDAAHAADAHPTAPEGGADSGEADAACTGDTWDHDSDRATTCSPRTRCSAGQYVVANGSATSDRTCGACSPGSFSSQLNSSTCSPWRECIWQLSAGATSRDRACVEHWSRQFGGVGSDYGFALSLDTAGAVYLAGSVGTPLQGLQQLGATDAFLRKYDSMGADVWRQQLGSTGYDSAHAMGVDRTGHILIGGSVGGVAVDAFILNQDAFLSKYDSNGVLIWTRQFGTMSGDVVLALDTDQNGRVYVAGNTFGSFTGETTSENLDVFVQKYDAQGTLLWTRQFGTLGPDTGWALAAATDGVYVAGTVGGFALPGQVNSGASDAFIRKLGANGEELWTRQFGTSTDDEAFAVRVNGSAGVLVTGSTLGTFPGATQGGGKDAFLASFDKFGNLQWVDQFGGAGDDSGMAMTTDQYLNIYLTGYVSSSQWGPYFGLKDVFVRKLTSDGSNIHSRQFGTNNDDVGRAIAVDVLGDIHVSGTAKAGLPGQAFGHNEDAFVLKFFPN